MSENGKPTRFLRSRGKSDAVFKVQHEVEGRPNLRARLWKLDRERRSFHDAFAVWIQILLQRREEGQRQ